MAACPKTGGHGSRSDLERLNEGEFLAERQFPRARSQDAVAHLQLVTKRLQPLRVRLEQGGVSRRAADALSVVQ